MADEQLLILIAEDDPNDAVLLERALQKAVRRSTFRICTNGDQAIEYLSGRGSYSDRATFPFPRMLLTDLKMPRRSGFELLKWLQAHPQCNVIPSIVMSASDTVEDVKLAYQLGANCYFRKPGSFSELCKIVDLLVGFWSVAALPPLPENC
jgi:CheY-like chemotaxis protein